QTSSSSSSSAHCFPLVLSCLNFLSDIASAISGLTLLHLLISVAVTISCMLSQDS
ncbi:hypothetical protein SUGI_0523730, partial [Cryptomeria japonica]